MALVKRNTLIAMPEHILDVILRFLDLADKKSFSETCVLFNSIFSSRVNLSKLKLILNDDAISEQLSRSYTNLSWNCNDGTAPAEFWERMSPTIESLHVGKSFSSAKTFAAALPYLSNLTHLDISLKNFKLYSHALYGIAPITMKQLQHLSIDFRLFVFLEGRHIKFETTKLRTLIIKDEYRPMVKSKGVEIVDKVRSLIEQQTNLEVLQYELVNLATKNFLAPEGFNRLFDRPLVIPSMLKKFVFRRSFGLVTIAQYRNIVNFVKSQSALVQLRGTMKLPRLAKLHSTDFLLDRPLLKQYIEDKSQESFRSHAEDDNSQYSNLITLDKIEFRPHLLQLNVPNMRTEEIELDMWEDSDEQQILSFITAKVPNLKIISVNVEERRNRWVLHQNPKDFSLLNCLQNLVALELDIRDTRCLNSINIHNLQCFTFYMYLDTSYNDIVEFVDRHKSIRTLKGEFIFDEDDCRCVFKMLEHICKNSVDTTCVNFCWYIDFPETSMTWQHVRSFILKHARPGFLFISEHYEIMKRSDGEIVEKVDGRWEKVEMPLKLRLRNIL